MATPTTLKFGAGVLYIGDGSATPVYTKVCGMTEWSLSIDKSTNDAAVPDCDNPDAPAWNLADVTAMGWTVSASGFAAVDAIPTIEAATFATVSRPVRLYLKGGGTGTGTPDRLYSGLAHVRHELSASLGERVQVSIELTGDGALTTTSSTIPTT